MAGWRIRFATTGFQGLLRKVLDFVSNFYVIDAILTANWRALWDVMKHLILPSIALGSIPMAIIARMTRSSMLEVLGEDYIRTARAKGLKERAVLFSHALRNALLPIITVIGLQAGFLLGGGNPHRNDLFLARAGAPRGKPHPGSRLSGAWQGSVIIIAFTFVLINLLVDVSYAYLDPRIHYD